MRKARKHARAKIKVAALRERGLRATVEMVNCPDRHFKKYRDMAERLKGGCAVCGERDPAVLEFHHKAHADKAMNISAMLHGGGQRQLRVELEKCEVLCANCHRRGHEAFRRRAVLVEAALASSDGPSFLANVFGGTPDVYKPGMWIGHVGFGPADPPDLSKKPLPT